jgi:hypothetical protein
VHYLFFKTKLHVQNWQWLNATFKGMIAPFASSIKMFFPTHLFGKAGTKTALREK